MPGPRPSFAAAAAAIAGAAWCCAACPVRAEDDAVSLRLVLHGRFTDRENTPNPVLLFDRSARAVDLGGYLRPRGSDAYPSTFAAISADGRHGRFRWGLTVDTGEVRSRSFPRLSDVCASSASPTGVDVVGSGRCNTLIPARRAVYALEDTRLAGAVASSNGRSFDDELTSTLLVREAWIGGAFGRNELALVKVGRKRFTVADGFVFDDYGLGVEANVDLGAVGPSWDLSAALFYPTRDFPSGGGLASPMLAVRADWLPSLFEHVGAFAALYRDGDNATAELFRGSFAEPSVVKLQGLTPGTLAYVAEERALVAIVGSPRESEAFLAWLGTSGNVRLARTLRLQWTGAVNLGNVTLRLPDAGVESHGTVFGQLAHVRLRARVLRTLEVGGFFLFLSGDLPPTTKARLGVSPSYGGFLGISPFITATNVFFNGGVAETFASRQATTPGVNGRGVVAPGLLLSWFPLPAVTVDGRAAYLLAEERGPFGGRTYGPEVDLEVTWAPLSWLRLVAEADALFPGDFFPGRAPVTKLVLGFDLVSG